MSLTKSRTRQLSDTESRLLNLGIGIKIDAKYAGRLSAWYSIARMGYAENTIKNAVSDWKFFEDWCRLEKFSALPTAPAILVKFVDYVLGLKSPATIKRYIWTIGKYHQVANAGHPTLDGDFVECCRVIGRGLSKEQKERILKKHSHLAEPVYDENGDVLKENRIHHNLAKKQKQAEGLTWREMLKVQELLLVEPLVEVSATSQKKEDKSKRRLNGISMRNQRDKVICMMGYDTLRRVSELCRYRFEDIEFDEKDGHAIISSYQGKTNQEGDEENSYLCPDTVRELLKWCDMAKIKSGPLFPTLDMVGRFKYEDEEKLIQRFVTPNDVWRIYKRVAKIIGCDPKIFSPHSTRVGACQDLQEESIGMMLVQQAGNWKSPSMPTRYGKKGNTKRGAMAQLADRKKRG